MSTTIRQADPRDALAVVELWREAGAHPTHTDDAASVMQLLAHDPDSLIVAESDDLIVGSVIAAWDGWRGSIYRRVVAPSHRRCGLGARLVRDAEQRLAGVGAVRRYR